MLQRLIKLPHGQGPTVCITSNGDTGLIPKVSRSGTTEKVRPAGQSIVLERAYSSASQDGNSVATLSSKFNIF